MKPFIKRAPGVASAGAPPLPTESITSPTESQGAAYESAKATTGVPSPRKERGYILNGSISAGVLKVAIPSVATMLLQTTNGFLDRFFVGSLGPAGLAAISVSSTLMFALMSAAMAISVGTTALVARFIGEGDIKNAETATQQSLILSVLISLAVGLPMWLLRHPMLQLLGLDAAALPQAEAYLNITTLGMPTLFLMLILNGAFRGIGDTIKPFWVTLGANLVHASFNWLLIFGNLGFPRMGLAGGGLALVLSQTAATVLYLYFLRGSVLKNTVTSPTLRVDRDWAWRIGKIGLPASAQQLIRVGSMLVFQGMLGRLGAGTAAVAALGVGLVSESIAFMPGFGYSIAASAFVGQNLGARQVDRAEKGAWIATGQALVVMSVMGMVFWIFAAPFAHLFIHHRPGETAADFAQTEQTILLTVLYLRTAAWSEPFLGLGMVLTGALQGAGETLSPVLLTIITMVGIRLPLAWLLMSYFHWGTAGAWWAMSLSTIVQGTLIAYVFYRGKWRTQRV